MQTTPVIVNELQLAPKLHQAVDQNHRGDFGLLLALLSQDACDWPQFHLQDGGSTEQQLHKQFELPPTEPLLANLATDAVVTDNSATFAEQGATAFRLQQCLRPEALVIRGEHSMEMSEVIENLDLHSRSRYAGTAINVLPQVPDFADQLTEQRMWLNKSIAA
ncbi:VC2046/SO_2500 family protein [Shewanella sp.]|uniref:VC2046/SO_2500 family protein n=1 Tax=Shewanella sp. TaxID=50422 RepID=UPI003A982EE0